MERNMLFKVEIENFHSISEPQSIDLCARRSVEDTLGRLLPIHQGSDRYCPAVVALFGSNAAGKSNVLRAITFGAWFVTQSFTQNAKEHLPYQKFGTMEKISAPTRLSYTFSGPADFLHPSGGGLQCPYMYEFILSPRTQEDFVSFERLSCQPRGFGKPTTIFERCVDGSLRFARGFMNASHEKALKAVLRNNASAICTLAQLNHEIAMFFVNRISEIQSNIWFDRYESNDDHVNRWYASNPTLLNQLKTIGQRMDLGIEQIDINQSMGTPRLMFQHLGLEFPVEFQLESHGTRQFVKLYPLMQHALDSGSIVVVDDMDSAVHPHLLPEICRWFTDHEINPHGAQLWMTCHSPSLMNELTKEGILFCEKDTLGRTSIYGLVDIEGVRRNENFYGNYMSGEYGAVPRFG